MTDTKHTPGPWSQGTTLITPATREWTKEKIEENNRIERRLVFSNFTSIDAGMGRNLIAACTREEDARLIAETPNLLFTLQYIADNSATITRQRMVSMAEMAIARVHPKEDANND